MFELDWFHYPLIVVAGVAAGFINTVAGSGSAVTISLLLFLGVPAPLANGTNRVAILLQCGAATATFRRAGALDTRGALILAVPAAIGAAGGAWLASDLGELQMKRFIGLALLVVLVLLFARPKRWLDGRLRSLPARPGWGTLALFLAIGVYGGFVQIGVGVFLLSGLVLGAGYDVLRANPVKVLIVLVFTVVALAIYAGAGQVDPVIGLTLAAGNIFGAWIGARTALARGASFVRWVLIVVVTVSAARFLGLFELFELFA